MKPLQNTGGREMPSCSEKSYYAPVVVRGAYISPWDLV